MPKIMQDLIKQYVEAVKNIYGSHIRQIILYGSYARGDFRPDSDVDIMILVDMSDLELKAYAQQLSYMTYDFNMDHDLDIKPIAKSEAPACRLLFPVPGEIPYSSDFFPMYRKEFS